MPHVGAVETGVCFIAFNVPVNQETSRAHCSIVEDGILVRLPRHSFDAARVALRSGKDFIISDSEFVDVGGDELVIVRWVDDASCFDFSERYRSYVYI